MNYRYYIVDTMDCSVRGTDSLECANSYALSDMYVVIDTHTNKVLITEDAVIPVG